MQHMWRPSTALSRGSVGPSSSWPLPFKNANTAHVQFQKRYSVWDVMNSHVFSFTPIMIFGSPSHACLSKQSKLDKGLWYDLKLDTVIYEKLRTARSMKNVLASTYQINSRENKVWTHSDAETTRDETQDRCVRRLFSLRINERHLFDSKGSSKNQTSL